MTLLGRISRRYLLRYRWQTLLSIIGIGLGVAVVVAVDLANQSARRAFNLSMESVIGRTTHHLIGGPDGFDETLYRDLRLRVGLRQSAPVIEGFVLLGEEPLRLLGVDPFAEEQVRSRLGEVEGETLRRLIIEPGSVVVGAADAERLGIAVGDRLTLDVDGRQRSVRVVGVLGDSPSAAAAALLIADITTGQELLGRVGRLDRIDLVLDSRAARAKVDAWLPDGLALVSSESRTLSAEQMTRAFRTNLTAMSLLALLVGAFLINNTMSFSVLRRRRTLATLRILGVTRGEMFRLILSEAVQSALLGTLLGIALGILLGQGLVHLVTRTINDLYFVLAVTDLSIDPLSLLKGVALGVVAALLAAAVPARQAANAAPVAALHRSVSEERARRATPRMAWSGASLALAAVLLLFVPTSSIVVGYLALFLLVAGFSLLVPAFAAGVSRLAFWPFARLFGPVGALAARGVPATLSRSGIAITALAVAVSATVGVGVMVASFRFTVVEWLEQTLESDIYITAPHTVSSRTDGTLDPEIVQRLAGLEGVAARSLRRRVEVASSEGQLSLLAIDLPKAAKGPRIKRGQWEAVRESFRSGNAVLVSEPFAYQTKLQTGDTITLLTPVGPVVFAIAGIFYHYGSDQRLILMDRERYRTLWNDSRLSSVGLQLAEGVSNRAALEAVRQRLAHLSQQPLVRSHREIRDLSLDILDRTFLITRVLRLLAVGVAFVGVLSALMALQLERAKEHAVLRATGLTPRELFALVGLQTGLMGLIAGLLALPLGLATAAVLITVINQRSFGWSMQTFIPLEVLAEAVALAVAAALLAGLYPAVRMARTSPAEALREE